MKRSLQFIPYDPNEHGTLGSRAVKLHRHRLDLPCPLLHHIALELADHVHFAGLAVEYQLELFAAIDKHQRLGLDRAVNAGHALGLLGAQAQ